MRPALLPTVAAAAALIVCVDAAVLGWHLGSRGSSAPAPDPAPAVRVGPARVTVPSEWRPIPLSRAGLRLHDAVSARAFDIAPGLPARVVVLLAPAADATLLPQALRDAGAGAFPRAVKLGGNPAWRYSGSESRNSRLLEVTVLPTTAGILAVGCLAPSFASTVAIGCAERIGRLRLDGGRVLAPGASPALRAALPAAMEKLRESRVRSRAALARARTAAGQAAAGRALAKAFTRTAKRLSPVAQRDGGRQRLLGALRDTAGAYGRLAAAAAAERRAAYDRARAEVGRAERVTDAALGRAERATDAALGG